MKTVLSRFFALALLLSITPLFGVTLEEVSADDTTAVSKARPVVYDSNQYPQVSKALVLRKNDFQRRAAVPSTKRYDWFEKMMGTLYSYTLKPYGFSESQELKRLLDKRQAAKRSPSNPKLSSYEVIKLDYLLFTRDHSNWANAIYFSLLGVGIASGGYKVLTRFGSYIAEQHRVAVMNHIGPF